MQLPELFCGFRRIAGEAPIAHPVACLPQAWAAGSAFMLLQACLGLSIDAWNDEVRIEHPRLPTGIDRLTIANLPVDKGRITLHFHRVDQRVVTYSDPGEGPPVSVLVHV
jgi:glycogen debranching enzyme